MRGPNLSSLIILLIIIVPTSLSLWYFVISPTLNENYLEQNGINGTAVILEANQTGSYFNNNPEIRFKLLVTIPGKEPYVANITTVVAMIDLTNTQPGNKWYVLVDPKNPQNVMFA